MQLFLSSCDERSETSFEYIYRESQDELFSPKEAKFVERTPFPWEDKYADRYPRITKDFFRCKGSSSNPTLVLGDGEKKQFIKDCRSSDRHSLPIKDGTEFVYPCLIDILNYVQEKTQKKVVITSGHRCPDHNAYVEPRAFSSKHMMAAEVDFYVEGLEKRPEYVISVIQGYYKDQGTAFAFKKSDNKGELTPAWSNKEIAIKLALAHEKRNFDNAHSNPYITISVRWDRETDGKVTFDDKLARNYLRN